MTYRKVNSSIVSKGLMNSFKEMFLLARMFPIAVIHREIKILDERVSISECFTEKET